MTGNDFDRRRFLRAGAAAVAAPCLVSIAPARAAGQTRVVLQLGWLAGNGVIGEVFGDARGYYAEEGLELEIVPGGPNINGVASVASRRATTGQIGSSPALMLARSAGIPVKAIAAGYQKHPFTYFSLESDPIRRPEDLIGKTVATQPTSVVLLRAMLRRHGIDEKEVTVMHMGSDMNLLLSGQAQAVTGWKTNTGALAVLGPERVDMMLWDGGIRLYSNVYYTTDTELEERPDALAAFIRATARGWCAVRADPEAAVDALVARYPLLAREAELAATSMAMGFAFDETVAAEGWGAMSRENWQDQIDTYAALDQFKGEVPSLDDVMSSAVLEATFDARMAAC